MAFKIIVWIALGLASSRALRAEEISDPWLHAFPTREESGLPIGQVALAASEGLSGAIATGLLGPEALELQPLLAVRAHREAHRQITRELPVFSEALARNQSLREQLKFYLGRSGADRNERLQLIRLELAKTEPELQFFRELVQKRAAEILVDFKAGRPVPPSLAYEFAEFKAIRNALRITSAFGMYSVVDGGARLGAALTGNNPGFTPAVSLGRAIVKKETRIFRDELNASPANAAGAQ